MIFLRSNTILLRIMANLSFFPVFEKVKCFIKENPFFFQENPKFCTYLWNFTFPV